MEVLLFPLQFFTTICLLLVAGSAITEAFFGTVKGFQSAPSRLRLWSLGALLSLLCLGVNQVFWLGQGEWQPFVLALALESGFGTALKIKALGVATIVVASFAAALRVPVYLFGSAMVAYGFSASGHTQSLNPTWGPVLITVHVWIASFWLGSLWPLCRALFKGEREAALVFIEEFALAALVLIPVLLLVGVWLMLALNGWPSQWTWNGYQKVLVLKVIGVFLLLGFALWHRKALTPKLKRAQQREVQATSEAQRLRRSIGREAWVMVFWVVLATAWMTSMDGPPSAH